MNNACIFTNSVWRGFLRNSYCQLGQNWVKFLLKLRKCHFRNVLGAVSPHLPESLRFSLGCHTPSVNSWLCASSRPKPLGWLSQYSSFPVFLYVCLYVSKGLCRLFICLSVSRSFCSPVRLSIGSFHVLIGVFVYLLAYILRTDGFYFIC